MSSDYSYQDDPPVIPNTLHPLKIYYYRESRRSWRHVSSRLNDNKTSPSICRIVTWNVDFASRHVHERLKSAIRHLETAVLGCKNGEAPEPSCILLQEVHADALSVLLDDDWIREHFYMTPVAGDKWPDDADYGNVTLVSKSLTVVRAQILHLGISSLQRTGLMIDIKLGAPTSEGQEIMFRVINTHLDSPPGGAHARSIQIPVLAEFLRQEDVDGGLIAGDMNAVSPSDTALAKDNGLRDAWKKGDHESGFTWGYQGGGSFPRARLDKILYQFQKYYRVDEPKRIGVGVRTVDEDQGIAMWTSDHYGLGTTVRVLR